MSRNHTARIPLADDDTTTAMDGLVDHLSTENSLRFDLGEACKHESVKAYLDSWPGVIRTRLQVARREGIFFCDDLCEDWCGETWIMRKQPPLGLKGDKFRRVFKELAACAKSESGSILKVVAVSPIVVGCYLSEVVDLLEINQTSILQLVMGGNELYPPHNQFYEPSQEAITRLVEYLASDNSTVTSVILCGNRSTSLKNIAKLAESMAKIRVVSNSVKNVVLTSTPHSEHLVLGEEMGSLNHLFGPDHLFGKIKRVVYCKCQVQTCFLAGAVFNAWDRNDGLELVFNHHSRVTIVRDRGPPFFVGTRPHNRNVPQEGYPYYYYRCVVWMPGSNKMQMVSAASPHGLSRMGAGGGDLCGDPNKCLRSLKLARALITDYCLGAGKHLWHLLRGPWDICPSEKDIRDHFVEELKTNLLSHYMLENKNILMVLLPTPNLTFFGRLVALFAGACAAVKRRSSFGGQGGGKRRRLDNA